MKCLLFNDPPADGDWNMAVDEAMLDEAVASGRAALRFYRWQQAALSLGYFQRSADRSGHEPSLQAPMVRRLSGGGAIIHDREITYSFALPAEHPQAAESVALYRIAHNTLIDILRGLGIHARLHGNQNICAERYPQSAAARCADEPLQATSHPADGKQPKHRKEQPFLCFQRFCTDDVLLDGPEGQTTAKIAGSAQRHRRGAVLQHGSVLLDMSPAAPELPGIRQLSGILPDEQQLCTQWGRAIADALDVEILPCERNNAVGEAVRRLREDKYNHPAWTERR